MEYGKVGTCFESLRWGILLSCSNTLIMYDSGKVTTHPAEEKARTLIILSKKNFV